MISSPINDTTFRAYNSAQAASFARSRTSYSEVLYQVILDHHISANGRFENLLDIGCGSGAATRGLSRYFDHALGIDPGEALIEQARSLGGTTKDGGSIKYEIFSAEDMCNISSMKEGMVYLLTVGMAAHWFDMNRFWADAASMVKQGGTIAIWTKASLYCHPSTRRAAEVQQILSELEDVILGPTKRHSITNVTAFPLEKSERFEWNRDGKLEANEEDFFGGSVERSLGDLEASLGTASMVTKWREASPDLAGTGLDCVKLTVRKLARVLASPDTDPADIRIRTGSSTTLLIFSRH